MITVRQLERLWQVQDYHRIAKLCLEMRPENSVRLTLQAGRAVPAAALAIIRLDELAQAHVPFCSKMIRTVIAAQEADGGWGDPLTTALCVRALACSNGQGLALDRGIAYLAALQKDEGLWPRVPLRRLPADAYVSAFILFQLMEDDRFASAVRLDDALGWFDDHEFALDEETARLWRSVAQKRRALGRQVAPLPVPAWS